ncbi:MAG: methyltransferase domain-containing protein [Candidatus Hydrogenedentota bacterium]
MTIHRDDLLREYLRVAPLSRALIRSKEIELILRKRPDGRIIDLGHGDGHFAAILARHGVRLFVGMDISLEELRRARGRTATHLVVGDMQRAPFRGGVFDGAISNCVLEHVERIDATFREAHRMMKPGGRFIATVVADGYEILLFWPRFFGRIGLRPAAKAYLTYIERRFVHQRYIPASEWIAEAEKAGLQCTHKEPYIGERRQMLMDLFLPGVVVARMMRALTGREVLPVPRWPVSLISGWLDDHGALEKGANAFLVLEKSAGGGAEITPGGNS